MARRSLVEEAQLRRAAEQVARVGRGRAPREPDPWQLRGPDRTRPKDRQRGRCLGCRVKPAHTRGYCPGCYERVRHGRPLDEPQDFDPLSDQEKEP